VRNVGSVTNTVERIDAFMSHVLEPRQLIHKQDFSPMKQPPPKRPNCLAEPEHIPTMAFSLARFRVSPDVLDPWVRRMLERAHRGYSSHSQCNQGPGMHESEFVRSPSIEGGTHSETGPAADVSLRQHEQQEACELGSYGKRLHGK